MTAWSAYNKDHLAKSPKKAQMRYDESSDLGFHAFKDEGSSEVIKSILRVDG